MKISSYLTISNTIVSTDNHLYTPEIWMHKYYNIIYTKVKEQETQLTFVQTLSIEVPVYDSMTG